MELVSSNSIFKGALRADLSGALHGSSLRCTPRGRVSWSHTAGKRRGQGVPAREERAGKPARPLRQPPLLAHIQNDLPFGYKEGIGKQLLLGQGTFGFPLALERTVGGWSSRAGRALPRQAAPRRPPCGLELGHGRCPVTRRSGVAAEMGAHGSPEMGSDMTPR